MRKLKWPLTAVLLITGTLVSAQDDPFVPEHQGVVVDLLSDVRRYISGGEVQNSSGAFDYTIELGTPAAPRGPRPSLQLRYDSQRGNGPFGIGWGLTATSSISRCQQTIGEDGQVAAVTSTTSDRFCLDDDKLVAVQGSYGADGTEYRTVVEHWRRVISHGATAGLVDYFTVQTPDGVTSEYGRTPDSRIASTLGPPRMWLLSRMTDTSGNTVTFSYDPGSTSGMPLLTSIAYGSNAAANSTPVATVTIDYQTRADTVATFAAGDTATLTKVASSLRVATASGVVRSANFNYEQSPDTNASRLASVVLIDNRNGEQLPYRFTYETRSASTRPWHGNQSQSSVSEWGAYRWFADVDGDGLLDYVAKNNDGTLHWTLNQGDHFGPSRDQSGLHGLGSDRWLVDINGDGRADYVAKNQDGDLHWNLSVNTGSDTVIWGPSRNQSLLNGYGSDRWLVDINGDGKADYVVKNPDNTIHWNLSAGDGTTDTHWGSNHHQGSLAPFGTYRWLVDLNGDGKVDYLTTDVQGSFHWNLSVGDGTTDQHWGTTQDQTGMHGFGDERWLVDINGDGLPDYVAENSDGSLHWNINTGRGWGPRRDQSGLAGFGIARWLADINGDGKADYVVKTAEGSIAWNLARGDGGPGHFGPTDHQDGVHGMGSERWLFDLDGDGKADYVAKNQDTSLHWNVTNRVATDLLSTITEPFGRSITVTYKTLASSSDATGAAVTYPTRLLTTPLYVVDRTSTSTTADDPHVIDRRYGRALFDVHLRRFLGFSQVVTTDQTRQIETTRHFLQTFPLDGLPVDEQMRDVTHNQIVASSKYFWQTYPGQHPKVAVDLLTGDEHTTFDQHGTQLGHTWHSYAYDAYGNNVSSSEASDDGTVAMIVRTVRNDVEHWWLGLTEREQTRRMTPAGQIASREWRAEYDDRGRIRQSVWLPGTEISLTTTFSRNSAGQVTDVVRASADGISRHNGFGYDHYGFPNRFVDALNHIEERVVDAGTGRWTSRTDSNGNVTTRTVDGFGQLRAEMDPGQVETLVTYDRGGAAPLVVTRRRQGAPAVRVSYGQDGLATQTAVEGFDGGLEITDYRWDPLSRLHARSLVHRADAATAFESFEYDAFDRVTAANLANGRRLAFRYAGNRIEQFENRTPTETREFDSTGALVSVARGATTTSYAYDADGHVRSLKGPLGSAAVFEYDPNGNVSSYTDGDGGRWRYEYNAFGELLRATNPTGGVTQYKYDPLSRLLEAESPEERLSWAYDTAAHGVGLIASAATSKGYTETFAYDELQRLIATTRQWPGETLITKATYDRFGHVASLMYPEQTGATTAVYEYTSTGYPSKVSLADGTPLWKMDGMTGPGLIKAEHLLGGLDTTYDYDVATQRLTALTTRKGDTVVRQDRFRYDLRGRLVEDRDSLLKEVQEFQYDQQNRLSAWTLRNDTGVPKATELYTFDAEGRLTRNNAVASFRYGERGAGPNGVTSSDWLRGFSRRTDSYEYDALGGRVSQPGLQFGYDANGRIARWQKTDAAHHDDVDETFSPFGTLVTTTVKSRNREGWAALLPRTSLSTTYYAGKLFEKQVRGRSNHTASYVYVGPRPVAVVINVTGANGQVRRTVYGIHTNYQGSIVGLSDGDGRFVATERYEPFGRPRRDSDADVLSVITRGFGGFRHDAATGVVQMGRRLYDPVTAQFQSPDHRLSLGHDYASFNRYAYAAGDPVNNVELDGASSVSVGTGHIVGGTLTAISSYGLFVAAIGLAPETGGASLGLLTLSGLGATAGVVGMTVGGVGASIGVVEINSGRTNPATDEALGLAGSPGQMGGALYGALRGYEGEKLTEMRENGELIEQFMLMGIAGVDLGKSLRGHEAKPFLERAATLIDFTKLEFSGQGHTPEHPVPESPRENRHNDTRGDSHAGVERRGSGAGERNQATQHETQSQGPQKPDTTRPDTSNSGTNGPDDFGGATTSGNPPP
jgi:RHS repeat-associated protein